MRRGFAFKAFLASAFLVGCGDAGGGAHRAVDSRSALANPPELLELENVSSRQELFRDLVRVSNVQAGQPGGKAVLFAVNRAGAWVAAPGLDPRTELLQPQDGGLGISLAFSGRPEDRWPEDPRESLQGLSEKEAAELIAPKLLARWGISGPAQVQLDRALGAPYAAAYVDGILKLNPSFLYLAASASAP
jgi:hypothetical protein